MKRIVQFIFGTMAFIFLASLLLGLGGMLALMNDEDEKVSNKSIVALHLDGVISEERDTRDFLELLRKYREKDAVKGFLIRVSSPGGVVGPSQELHSEIIRTREEFKKPVIAYCSSVMASGAYYAAVGADQIYTTPGCMIGSIGALMSFQNLEKLYDWAKIQRYSITTGKFKDSGADYKAMSSEEKALFQDLLNNVLSQFKKAILEGRKLKPEQLDPYADGRVFTGEQAVALGLADHVGSWDDARKALGQLTGLGDNPEVFKAKKKKGFFEWMEEASGDAKIKALSEQILKPHLSGRPLLIFPGALN